MPHSPRSVGGGPAYPLATRESGVGEHGALLVDYFACSIMAAFCGADKKRPKPEDYDTLCDEAYALAELMVHHHDHIIQGGH